MQGLFIRSLSILPKSLNQLVVDYFRWRQEDATRNALNAHCYWLLRKEGKSMKDATNALLRLSVTEKNMELPMKEAYEAFIVDRLRQNPG